MPRAYSGLARMELFLHTSRINLEKNLSSIASEMGTARKNLEKNLPSIASEMGTALKGKKEANSSL